MNYYKEIKTKINIINEYSKKLVVEVSIKSKEYERLPNET